MGASTDSFWSSGKAGKELGLGLQQPWEMLKMTRKIDPKTFDSSCSALL